MPGETEYIQFAPEFERQHRFVGQADCLALIRQIYKLFEQFEQSEKAAAEQLAQNKKKVGEIIARIRSK